MLFRAMLAGTPLTALAPATLNITSSPATGIPVGVQLVVVAQEPVPASAQVLVAASAEPPTNVAATTNNKTNTFLIFTNLVIPTIKLFAKNICMPNNNV
jgi:hypothetical protein